MSAAQLFVFKATQDGMAEIELGNLAQKRAKDPMVKSFAAMMVTDHTKVAQELSALAGKKGWKVPTALDDEHAKMVHSLSAKPDSEFDNEYGKRMIEAHDKAVVLFQDAAAVSDTGARGLCEEDIADAAEPSAARCDVAGEATADAGARSRSARSEYREP